MLYIDEWFDSWSDMCTLIDVIEAVMTSTERVDEFHSSRWSTRQRVGVTFRTYMNHQGWTLDCLQLILRERRLAAELKDLRSKIRSNSSLEFVSDSMEAAVVPDLATLVS